MMNDLLKIIREVRTVGQIDLEQEEQLNQLLWNTPMDTILKISLLHLEHDIVSGKVLILANT